MNPIDRALDRVIDADLQRLQRIALARLPRPSVAELADGARCDGQGVLPPGPPSDRSSSATSVSAAPAAPVATTLPAWAPGSVHGPDAVPTGARSGPTRPRIAPLPVPPPSRHLGTADLLLFALAAVALVVGTILALQLA